MSSLVVFANILNMLLLILSLIVILSILDSISVQIIENLQLQERRKIY